MNVGFSVSQVTSTVCTADVQPGTLGDTVSVIVTIAGVAGQVNIGDALAGLSKIPAVAVHAYIGVSEPAVAVAASAIEVLTVVSSGNTDSDVIVAHTAVEASMTTAPDPLPFAMQVRVSMTGLVMPAATENPAEPAHENAPSTVVAVRLTV